MNSRRLTLFAASYGYSPDFVQHMIKATLTIGRGSIAGRVLSEGRAVHVPDVQCDPSTH
jgi:hypothetical protein